LKSAGDRLPFALPLANGVELLLQIQPRASRTRIVGEHGGALKIQIAAPPVDGAANAELIAFLSETFGIPKKQVDLVAGDAGRKKRVRLWGVDVAGVEAVMNLLD
jgi:uncharacterized protein